MWVEWGGHEVLRHVLGLYLYHICLCWAKTRHRFDSHLQEGMKESSGALLCEAAAPLPGLMRAASTHNCNTPRDTDLHSDRHGDRVQLLNQLIDCVNDHMLRAPVHRRLALVTLVLAGLHRGDLDGGRYEEEEEEGGVQGVGQHVNGRTHSPFSAHTLLRGIVHLFTDSKSSSGGTCTKTSHVHMFTVPYCAAMPPHMPLHFSNHPPHHSACIESIGLL